MRIVRFLTRWAAYLFAAWMLSCCFGLLYLRFLPPLITMVQLQDVFEHALRGELVWPDSTWVPLRSISPNLQHAVIASEDSRFYQHFGLDWVEIREASERALAGGRRRGASTITQQLAKNLFLRNDRSVLRKVVEVPLTLLAEVILPKQRILELYLNVAEWGPEIYGAEAAAQKYYGVPASALSRDQAARLAACLPSPRKRQPARMTRLAAAIQARMQRMGW